MEDRENKVESAVDKLLLEGKAFEDEQIIHVFLDQLAHALGAHLEVSIDITAKLADSEFKMGEIS